MATTVTRVSAGTSLKSLVQGFVLTKLTDGKSPKTLSFYGDNLKRFLWFAQQQGWPDDARLIDEWAIRQFLAYVRTEKHRWGLIGPGSETSQRPASASTLWHYFVVLDNFFGWTTHEGFLQRNPMTNVRVNKPQDKVIEPYSRDEIERMLKVCDYDYTHNAKFLGSRNRALVCVFLDTGVRLEELVRMKMGDIDEKTGHTKVLGKGDRQRIVRLGNSARKALWRYLIHRPQNGEQALWLNEEGHPLTANGVQCLVQRLKERARITTQGSVHRFRHTFAINFLRKDKDITHLQLLLGHSTIQMTLRYLASIGVEEALKAHETASPLDGMGF